MKASVFIATSLDGFIARQDGGLDWLPSAGEAHGYEGFWATIDAVVIGRKTFEAVLAFGGWPYGSKPVVVLSTTLSKLKAPDGAVCDLMAGTPRQIVEKLAQRGLEHLYIDGGVTIRDFLEAGLIQHFIVTRIPVLLGSGIPLFGPVPRDIQLKHVATRSFPNGMVQSEYVIASQGFAAPPNSLLKPVYSRRTDQR